MLNFYKIVKENLRFNRFEWKETVCLEYTCPIDAEQIGIFSRNDYLVYVLSGNSNLILSQVTLESGFEDLSHFSRAFKNIMGVSPSDYKKSVAQA
jgi:AraC-like DNA-binding protein